MCLTGGKTWGMRPYTLGVTQNQPLKLRGTWILGGVQSRSPVLAPSLVHNPTPGHSAMGTTARRVPSYVRGAAVVLQAPAGAGSLALGLSDASGCK